jgi:hypothetical protein
VRDPRTSFDSKLHTLNSFDIVLEHTYEVKVQRMSPGSRTMRVVRYLRIYLYVKTVFETCYFGACLYLTNDGGWFATFRENCTYIDDSNAGTRACKPLLSLVFDILTLDMDCNA